MTQIIVLDVDGTLLLRNGLPRPGVKTTIATLIALGYSIHVWSAAGSHHAHNVCVAMGLNVPCHTKPPMPMTEYEALRIIGGKPVLQIDDDRSQRIADWPFMVWKQR